MKNYEILKAAAEKRRESGEKNKPAQMNLILRAEADPASRKKAIDAFCMNCMGGTRLELPDPGWRKAIGNCTCPDCPLYRFRPYQQRDKDEKE